MPNNYSLENPLTYTHTQVTVGATSTLVNAANPARIFFFARNTSNETIYIAVGTAATMAAIPLLSNDSIQFCLSERTNTVDNIYAICASGGKTLNVTIGV